MPRSKPPRPPKAKSLQPQAPLATHQTRMQVSWLRSLAVSIANHPAILLLGVVGVGVTILGVVVTAFYAPDIEVSGSDPASPFEFPFVVANESWALPMQNIIEHCSIKHLNSRIADVFLNIDFTKKKLPRIGVNGSANYSFGGINFRQQRTSIEVNLTFTFNNLYFLPRSKSQSFTWVVDGEHSKWIKGDSIN